MPEPMKGQTKEEWMSVCMGSKESRKTFPDVKQRAAVCMSKWNRRNKKAKASTQDDKDFLDGFLDKYPEYKPYFEEVDNAIGTKGR